MSEEQIALARRAVACVPIERWPDWTPVKTDIGMHGVLLTFCGNRYVLWGDGNETPVKDDAFPVLGAPAGIGSLLAVVREAHGRPDAVCCRGITGCGDVGWAVLCDRILVALTNQYATEAEALVSALEAAP